MTAGSDPGAEGAPKAELAMESAMSWLTNMSDAELEHTIARLRSDIESFRARAAAVAAHVEGSGLDAKEDALHQRLTGIQGHLSRQLVEAQEEAALRRKNRMHRDGNRLWRGLLASIRRSQTSSAGADE
jgi:hypothetical protein